MPILDPRFFPGAARLNPGTGLIVNPSNGGAPVARSVAAGNSITVTNGDGDSGNPTVAVTTNGIGNTQLRQGGSLSVIGRAANSAGDVADIAGGTNQVLRVSSGNVLGFGSINLAAAQTVGSSVLPVENGGYTGFSSINNLTGKNNSGTPNTQYDLNCTSVVLISAANGTAVKIAGASTTNNILTAGSAANGRDQSGAFTNGSWVHFWWIYNGTTLATLSSASATAPTLPSGYTHQAYAGAVYLEAGGTLRKMRMRGGLMSVEASNDAAALSAGAATVETSVDLSAFVPANALEFHPVGLLINSNTTSASALRLISVTGRGAHTNVYASVAPAGPIDQFGQAIACMPYLGPTMYYQNSQSSGASYINILSFRVNNGAT